MRRGPALFCGCLPAKNDKWNVSARTKHHGDWFAGRNVCTRGWFLASSFHFPVVIIHTYHVGDGLMGSMCQNGLFSHPYHCRASRQCSSGPSPLTLSVNSGCDGQLEIPILCWYGYCFPFPPLDQSLNAKAAQIVLKQIWGRINPPGVVSLAELPHRVWIFAGKLNEWYSEAAQTRHRLDVKIGGVLAELALDYSHM